MIDKEQFRNLIVVPTLRQMDGVIPYSVEAVELLVATATSESLRGTYLAQKGGPALGVYQMEPVTHDDLHENFLQYRENLEDVVYDFVAGLYRKSGDNLAEEMVGNLYYATAMARVHYYRVPAPLPEADDLEGQAQYWKKWYNTELGKGTVEHFMELNKK